MPFCFAYPWRPFTTALAWATAPSCLSPPPLVLGIVGAFESPALAALLPLIAPQGSLQRATAISSGAAQIATITGPALGGLAYAFAPSAAYGLMGAFGFFAAIGIGMVRLSQPA